MGMWSSPNPGSPLDVVAACAHPLGTFCALCAGCEPKPDQTGAG